jgi:hypothetical protein
MFGYWVIFVHSELEGENCTMLTDRNSSNLEMLVNYVQLESQPKAQFGFGHRFKT